MKEYIEKYATRANHDDLVLAIMRGQQELIEAQGQRLKQIESLVNPFFEADTLEGDDAPEAPTPPNSPQGSGLDTMS